MSYVEKEKLIKADIASIENRVRHAFNQGYDLGYKEGKATTKNDLAQERYQDLIEYFGGEDTVLKDRKEFKAWLERVKWHVKRADELYRELEQLKATKNVIKALPSVTPQEPRIGHWIPTYGNVKCSECGSAKDNREVGMATHYCDFCGAKMESEDKE